jgi:hypothetical protein
MTARRLSAGVTDPRRPIDLDQLLALLLEWMGSSLTVGGDFGPFLGIAFNSRLAAAELMPPRDAALMLRFDNGVVVDLDPLEVGAFVCGEAQWVELAPKEPGSGALTLERARPNAAV